VSPSREVGDELFGGPGRDEIYGPGGSDLLSGGGGGDVIISAHAFANDGIDTVEGGPPTIPFAQTSCLAPTIRSRTSSSAATAPKTRSSSHPERIRSRTAR
jgi:Ca2+-binding RTX toxin-like protein